MGKVRRVLIVSVKAGAGHLRAAQALETVVRETHPDVEVRNVDVLDYTSAAFRRSFSQGYNKLAVELPSLWGMIYEQMERKPADAPSKRLAAFLDGMNTLKFTRMVREYDPDRIVCTHYLPAEPLAWRRRRGKLRARLCVTLTDYDIHTMWIQHGVDHYFVATEEMACALMAKGIGAAEVAVSGIPLMPAFAASYPDRAAMRRRLGLREAPLTVLVTTGGFGMARLSESVGMLADMIEEDVQLLAVAGRNEELRAALEDEAERRKGRIVPFGFVDNMHELMAASDFAVGKSGGLSSSECLAMGLPMVIVNPIPGQEERNADFLLESGVALRANSPAHLVYKVRKLIGEPALLERMRAATRAVARPRAAYRVIEEVMRERE